MGDKFYLTLRDGWFEKGDILNDFYSGKLKVIRTYKRTWWRQFIYYNLGIKIRMDSLVDSIIKVKHIK